MKSYKRIHRKLMRKVARFIHGFDRCPVDYKRNIKNEILTILDAILVTGGVIVIASVMVLIFM
jgi:hypothetical protein